ncbi:TetR/AcrR family transcriptional regulator [Paenibacillus zeisoli]|uniref:TetR/AcrR family transcriptional regulator n=1 Tax=Paenibacillus zeisoli TaxID=2496267 RepID=A0A3S1JSE4_9BACL|nr:TetR/AcrR family transcriptional regulator [Paenibacillus zeisoli]RUT35631.1 TetR/AcrR family transcriptional regulator [Paenibacillus zeisoli]
MEQLKKRQIMNMAMEVFKDKGYVNASMQDIAEKCGMAKGSIYKLFPSKEELFIAVFEDCYYQMFILAEELERKRKQERWTREQLFLQHIAFQLEYITEHYFLMMEFKELPIKTNELFISITMKKKDYMLKWHRDFILNMYGEQAEACIWDIVMIYRGILKEYLSLLQQHVIGLSIAEIAAFIVSRMHALVADLRAKDADPILKESNILNNASNPANQQMTQAAVHELLDSIIKELQQDTEGENLNRQQLLEVTGLMRKEYDLPTANPTMLQVYMAFLETAPELRSYVRQLKLMLRF